MTKFVVNKPLTGKRPVVTVDAGLKPGQHRFQLVVIDNEGNKSKPAVLTVTIRGQVTPPVG